VAVKEYANSSLSSPIKGARRKTETMKLSLAPLALVAFPAVAAWSPAATFGATRSYSVATILNAYSTEVAGEAETESYRLGFKSEDAVVSPWHDIPLEGKDGAYNMVVEIPKYTKAKMEVATKEENNPIAQDIKKGKLRDYHGPIFWNYGCLPQTWEDPNEEHPELKVFGDNDPIDVVEIGSKALESGSVTEVKALGCIAMIDDGELDWKVIAVATDDPLAAEYNDIDDVPDAVLSGVREWFRWYKTPDDKPLNGFGFDEKYLNAEETKKVIEETHESWKKLRSGDTDAGKLWVGK
jgi:inorganic pyrophosphatase